MGEVRLNIQKIIESETCILPEDGEKIFEEICKGISNQQKVILSFEGVVLITSAFLNDAIGKLYGKFKEDEIKQHLSVENIRDSDKVILKQVIDNAKIFYKDPKRILNSIKEAMEN